MAGILVLRRILLSPPSRFTMAKHSLTEWSRRGAPSCLVSFPFAYNHSSETDYQDQRFFRRR